MVAACLNQSNDLDVISKCICSSMFFILCGYCMCNFVKVGDLRMQAQESRFTACLAISMFICITSCLIGVIQLTDLDDIMTNVDGVMVKKFDAAKYLEWLLTCPLMQTQLVIFAGPKAIKIGSYNTALYTAGTIGFGFIASLISNDKEIWKCVFFAFGSACFLIMARTLDQLLREATDHKACFFWGTHPLRHLFVFLVITWTPFPILWLMSPEGFMAANGELEGEGLDANFIISFANVTAKVLFVIGMQLAKVQLRAVTALEEQKSEKYATEPEVKQGWLAAGAPSEEHNAKVELHTLVMKMCCDYGAGPLMAKPIIQKMEAQCVRSVRTLALMSSTDITSLGAPSGVRVWLEKEAKQQMALDLVGEKEQNLEDLPDCRPGRRPSNASSGMLNAEPGKFVRGVSNKSEGEQSTKVSCQSQTRTGTSTPTGSEQFQQPFEEDWNRKLSPPGRLTPSSPRSPGCESGMPARQKTPEVSDNQQEARGSIRHMV